MRNLQNLERRDGLLFQNATVLTMDDHRVLYGCDVRVQGTGASSCITDVRENLVPYPGDQVIDCKGKYLLPGLIDAHVHFDHDYMGPLLLAAGITSVRNMRGYEEHAKRKQQILEGSLPGPFIESTGPILDGEDPTIPENDNWILHDPEEVEEAIAYTKEQGFRFVKTYPMLEPELYRYLMRRCADEDLPVSGHMTKTISHRELMDLGYYCCEHASSLPKADEDIDYISKAGIWFCPTQLVCETLPDYVWNGKKLTDLEHWESLPVCVQEEWLRKNEIIAESYKKQGIHPDIRIIIGRARRFLEHSDRVLAGSDCAYPGILPGFSLWTELAKLVSLYGLSAEEALLCATARPAQCMKLGGTKGRIVAGMDADLIVLAETPLSDIRHISSVQTVVADGRLYDQAFFAKELAKIHQIHELPEAPGSSPLPRS
nr:amidohydrolase [uncultured bacterium]